MLHTAILLRRGKHLLRLMFELYYDAVEVCGVYITWQVGIKEARGLPPVLSNFVFCQYTFWSHPPTTVPSVITPGDSVVPRKHPDDVVVLFNHSQVSLLDWCLESCYVSDILKVLKCNVRVQKELQKNGTDFEQQFCKFHSSIFCL